LSSIYYDTGNYLKSIDSNKNAIKYYTEDNNQNSLFLTKNRLGGIMHAQGFHDKALEIFEDALEIAEKLEYESGSVRILANLAVVHSSKGDFEKAFTLTKKARALAKDSNSQISYVHIDFNESHWNYEIGEFDKAMDMLDHLEKKLEDSEGDAYQNLVSYVKGSCLFSRGDYNTSKQLFFKRIKELELHNNKKMLLANFVYYSLSLKRLDEDFDKLKLYKIIEENEDEISYELNLRLYELLGEESYLIKAYNQVLNLSKQMNGDLKNTFSNYHIQKSILENYEILFS
jgi:ATP/maltotriose-dependent transcriptional regulator MalT